MSKPNAVPMVKAQELLTAHAAFDIYGSHAEYRALTGKEPPPYDSTRKIKRWADPEALSQDLPEVIYPNNIMLKEGTWIMRNGSPVLRPLVLPAEEAATVNLPPEDPSGHTSIQVWMEEVPCPFRNLLPGEIIVPTGAESGFNSGKFLAIRDVARFDAEQAKAADDSGKFTAADRAMLRAVAAKLGV